MSATSVAIAPVAMDRNALVQAILELEDDGEQPIDDPALACALALHLKPEIDRLAGLKRPIAAAEEEEEGEDLLEALSEAAGEPAGQGEAGEEEPEGEGAAATEEEADLRDRQAVRPAKAPRRRAPPLPQGEHPDLLSHPPQDRAHWIFMERFFSLEQHEEALGYTFPAENLARYHQDLDHFIEELLLLPRATEAVQRNDLQALQKLFASHLLIFRNPCIGDQDHKPIPCTLENLRHRYSSYFYKHTSRKPNWYEKYDFYTEPLAEPQWVLCDTEHLNCTFRTPERKLASYARTWDLPAENVRGKSVLEDIYDRIVCGELLGEDLFAGSHNSCTSTTYRYKKKSKVQKLVFTVQKVHKISIHGKEGIPHWRASRRLWPGVLPAIAFT